MAAMAGSVPGAGISDLPDQLLFQVLRAVDFRTRMVAQCVCKRWRALPRTFPELIADPYFTMTRPDSIVDQDGLEDLASWLIEHGRHVTSLRLTAHPPAPRENRVQSWRESQLWVTAAACLAAAAPTLRALRLTWHESVDLAHHFRLLRALTGLTVVSGEAIGCEILGGHTSIRDLSLSAFTLTQTTVDDFLPPHLTRLQLDVDPDRIPTQITRLHELKSLSLARVDPQGFHQPQLMQSLSLLGGLTQLEALEVSRSNMLNLLPDLSALSGLTYLGMRSTHWRQGDLAAALAPMTALRALDLSYQDLPSLPAPVLLLTGLRALAIAGEQFGLGEGPYCAALEYLEVDLEWLGREADNLALFPNLRSITLASFGQSGGDALLRRGLVGLLAAAPRLAHLVLAAEVAHAASGDGEQPAPAGGWGGATEGALPLAHAGRLVEFSRVRPRVGVALCVHGQQPSPAAVLEGRWQPQQ